MLLWYQTSMDDALAAHGDEVPGLVPVHIEWECDDLDRAEAFFGCVFLWQFEGDGRARDASYRGQHIGTFFQRPQPGASERQRTTVFVSVPSIDVALERVRAEGGRVEQGKTPSGDLGFEAVFVDPDGNRFGLLQTVKDAPSAP